jgi:hypothetical protein
VRDRTYEQIGSQKERATSNLGTLAGAVRSMTQQLRDDGQAGLAGYVTRAADEIDRWSSRLGEQDIDEALREVQNFARRRPTVFLGVAFGAGVLAARFLKSSSEYREGRTGSSSSQSAAAVGAAGRQSVAHDASRTGAGMTPPSGEEF